MNTSGKVVVVTGAGSGIGREVVLQLLAKGARVAAVDLRPEGLAETAERAAAGDRLSTHPVDISDRAAVQALPEQVVAAHGQVDGVVNMAGIIQPFISFVELPYEQIERVVDVNLWGTIYIDKAFLPVLIARPEASLVNVASMGALAPVPGQSLYGATKAAVTLLTQGIYAETRGTGVAVTLVIPGAVATGIADNSGAQRPGTPASDSDEAASRTTSADDAAAQVIAGIESGAFRVIIGKDARLIDKIARLSPKRATDLIAKKMASLIS